MPLNKGNFEIIFHLKRSNCEIIALLFTRNKYFISFPSWLQKTLWSILWALTFAKIKFIEKNAFYVINKMNLSFIKRNIHDMILNDGIKSRLSSRLRHTNTLMRVPQIRLLNYCKPRNGLFFFYFRSGGNVLRHV